MIGRETRVPTLALILAIVASYTELPAGEKWIQECPLVAGDFAPEGIAPESFGASVALGGDRAFVGAPGGEGAVFVFELSDGCLTLVAQLTSSDAAPGDGFGRSVALDGDRILVGAPGNDHAGGEDAGAAYVFDFDGSGWRQTAKLTASDAAPEDEFGSSVALDGNRVLVGAWSNDHGGLEAAGAAYVFDLTEGRLLEVAKLTAEVATAGESFGQSVALDGNRALVGPLAEAGYLFELTDSGWQPEAQLWPSGLNLAVGYSVALDGERALVGALGGTFVFEYWETQRDRGWSQTARLDDGSADWLGWSVALEGDRAVSATWFAGHVFEHSDPDSAFVWDRCDELPYGSVALDGDRILVGNEETGTVYLFSVASGGEDPPPFRRGDTNGDGEHNLTDAVLLLDWLFLEGPAPGCVAAGNTDGEAAVNLTDAVLLLNWLFLDGPAPVAPFPDCGPGQPADYEAPLGCDSPPEECR